jgi:heme exporter protein D
MIYLGGGRAFGGLITTRIGNLVLTALGVLCAVFGGRALAPMIWVGVVIAALGLVLFISHMVTSFRDKKRREAKRAEMRKAEAEKAAAPDTKA